MSLKITKEQMNSLETMIMKILHNKKSLSCKIIIAFSYYLKLLHLFCLTLLNATME